MLIDVMLCIGFVAGAGVMYIGVMKLISVMANGFEPDEAEVKESVKQEMAQKVKAQTSTVQIARTQKSRIAAELEAQEQNWEQESYKEGFKPRISLRTGADRKGKNRVSVGNARPYRVNMRKV